MDDVEKNQVELNKSYEHLSTVKKNLNFYELRQDVKLSIRYPTEKDDCKTFEKNNWKITLNVLYAKKEKTYHAYLSKHNSKFE